MMIKKIIITLPFLCGIAQASNIFDDAVTSCNGNYAIWQSTDGRYVNGDIKCEESKTHTDLRCYFPSVITIKVKKSTDGNFYGYTNEDGMNAKNSYIDFNATANDSEISVFIDGQKQGYSIDEHAFTSPLIKDKYTLDVK